MYESTRIPFTVVYRSSYLFLSISLSLSTMNYCNAMKRPSNLHPVPFVAPSTGISNFRPTLLQIGVHFLRNKINASRTKKLSQIRKQWCCSIYYRKKILSCLKTHFNYFINWTLFFYFVHFKWIQISSNYDKLFAWWYFVDFRKYFECINKINRKALLCGDYLNNVSYKKYHRK